MAVAAGGFWQDAGAMRSRGRKGDGGVREWIQLAMRRVAARAGPCTTVAACRAKNDDEKRHDGRRRITEEEAAADEGLADVFLGPLSQDGGRGGANSNSATALSAPVDTRQTNGDEDGEAQAPTRDAWVWRCGRRRLRWFFGWPCLAFFSGLVRSHGMLAGNGRSRTGQGHGVGGRVGPDNPPRGRENSAAAAGAIGSQGLPKGVECRMKRLFRNALAGASGEEF